MSDEQYIEMCRKDMSANSRESNDNNAAVNIIIIIELILLALLTVYISVGKTYASGWNITYTYEEDKTTGPGIGITKNYFEDDTISRIDNQTNNNIKGDAIHNSNVAEGVGPTYKENGIIAPINWLDIKSGPSSEHSFERNYYYYIKNNHFLDDNGPGTKMENELNGNQRVEITMETNENISPTTQTPVIYAPTPKKTPIIYAGSK